MKTNHYMSIDEVAQHYGVSRDTVRRLIRRGELDAIRIGRLLRISFSSVENLGR